MKYVHTRLRSKQSGFTMLELIIVVAIILILSGLLFPAILHLIEKAKKGRVRTQLHSIVAAAKSYKNEYGRWPGQAVQGVDFTTHHGDFIHDLTNNPRNFLFIEIDPTWVTGSGQNDTFVDAWGNEIYIALDRDGDGDVHVKPTPKNGFATLDQIVPNNTAAAVSWGNTPGDPDSLLNTWGL
ncbi:MAG: prepilin-type N-terminal cleavage/methylation domain-containing protein [Kiritimatiellae bacterium]|nr:prepilin-type N-terminal cleavage/methylation domain-containing protein [Kiritimatiellia bacterium]